MGLEGSGGFVGAVREPPSYNHQIPILIYFKNTFINFVL